METVSVDRGFDADPDRVRSALQDTAAFFDAAGFDIERVDDCLELTKRVALAQLELTVRLRDDAGTALAYEQVSGPFDAMATRYSVEPARAGSRLRIETTFDPPATGIGASLSGAAIERQRRRELDAVASLVESTDDAQSTATDGTAVGTGGG